MYRERAYRRWVNADGLVTFEVMEKETDLAISASRDLERQARSALLTYRKEIEDYIKLDCAFLTSLEPLSVRAGAPLIIRSMADAAAKAGVGPMAAVAGAVAEFVGRDLLQFSGEVIVENGGDIFLRSAKKRVMGIYAGEESPFTGKLAIETGPSEDGIGVCASSGTVSHSLSFGKSDAVVIMADEAALADAVATASGNMLKSSMDIEKAIDFARSVEGVNGALVIIKDKMGSWGGIKLV
ncbi:MAG: UPF0280 family protein [Candidatus Omnitrophica bacterium]|nr:UPF0280 family protein [Candidatus Omnitrophota bacterium]